MNLVEQISGRKGFTDGVNALGIALKNISLRIYSGEIIRAKD
jgi:hypothetical protein